MCDSEVLNEIKYPLQFLFLLFTVVMIPLLLHVVKKFLPIDQELLPMFLLPSINLHLQTLFQLEEDIDLS